MAALLTARADRARALRRVRIGSVAGPDLSLPSYRLRAANLTVLGSGQGSVTAGITAELPSLAREISSGALPVDALAVPLKDVERAWVRPAGPGGRVVLSP
ncbi:hypothetical protein AB0J21_27245 [Streptomyces sp. NPDC049954]|uniref:hypothetical protein n=1 Tax=Streptomyces sp. NPDC049954 TaxID=3155779 RepID=UPI003446C1EE